MTRLAFAALGLVALAGCAPTPVPVCNMDAILAQRQTVALPAQVPDAPSPLIEMPPNSVNITDYTILQKVFVRGVTAQRTPAGTVQVVSEIVNCTDFPLQAEGRTRFFGTGRMPVDETAWRRVHLPPRSTGVYRELSVGREVDSYVVELREGR